MMDCVLVGMKIKQFREMNMHERADYGWENWAVHVLEMENGWKLFVAQDEDLSAPGTFEISSPGESAAVSGETIVRVAPVGDVKYKDGTHPVVLELSNGVILLPFLEDEALPPGVWCGVDRMYALHTFTVMGV